LWRTAGQCAYFRDFETQPPQSKNLGNNLPVPKATEQFWSPKKKHGWQDIENRLYLNSVFRYLGDEPT